MRQRGVITEWNDDRGFGFITPSNGGSRVFFHISSVQGPGRPAGQQAVRYNLGKDAQGRTRATSVTLPGSRSRTQRNTRGLAIPELFALAFFALVAALASFGRLPLGVLWVYLLASGITYSVYAWDKSAARNGRWRTPEIRLHMLALGGGWPGALLARRKLRHKSSKRSFSLVFWLTVVINCGALGWVLTPEGAQWLDSLLQQLPADIRRWL